MDRTQQFQALDDWRKKLIISIAASYELFYFLEVKIINDPPPKNCLESKHGKFLLTSKLIVEQSSILGLDYHQCPPVLIQFKLQRLPKYVE